MVEYLAATDRGALWKRNPKSIAETLARIVARAASLQLHRVVKGTKQVIKRRENERKEERARTEGESVQASTRFFLALATFITKLKAFLLCVIIIIINGLLGFAAG